MALVVYREQAAEMTENDMRGNVQRTRYPSCQLGPWSQYLKSRCLKAESLLKSYREAPDMLYLYS